MRTLEASERSSFRVRLRLRSRVDVEGRLLALGLVAVSDLDKYGSCKISASGLEVKQASRTWETRSNLWTPSAATAGEH